MKKVICIIIFLTISFFLNAQDTIVLSFQDAIKMALEKNVNLRQQENGLKVTKVAKLQSVASYLPDLNITSYAKRVNGLQQNYLPAVVNTSDNFSYTFASNYTLFNGFSRLNTLLQSVSQHKAQLSQVEQTRQNTIFNMASQYLQVLLDEELIKIYSENLAAQKTNLERIKGFVEVNINSASDQYTQEAQVGLIEVQLLSIRNQFFADKATLASTLMLELGVNYKLLSPDWGIEKTLAENFELDSLWELAKNNRHDLKQLEQSNKASFYGIKIARSGIYPSLSFYYNYNSLYSTLFQPSFKTQILTVNPTHVVGLNLVIPIFNRLQFRSKIVNAKVNYRNNLLNFENYQNIVYSQISTAYNNFNTNKETYKVNEVGYLAAKLSFEKQAERFRLGLGNILELSLASQNYVQAKSNKAQSEFTLMFQKIILDYYTGKLNDTELYYK